MRLRTASTYTIFAELGDVAGALSKILASHKNAEVNDRTADFGIIRSFAYRSNRGGIACGDYFVMIGDQPAVWVELNRLRKNDEFTCNRILVNRVFRGRGLGRSLYRHIVLREGLTVMSGPNHTQYSKRLYEGFAQDRDLIVIGIAARSGHRFPIDLRPDAIYVNGKSIYEQLEDMRLLVSGLHA